MAQSLVQDPRGRPKRWLLLAEKDGHFAHQVVQAPNAVDAVKATGMNPAVFFAVTLLDHKDAAALLYPKFRALEAKCKEAHTDD